MVDGYTHEKTVATGQDGETCIVRSTDSSRLFYLKTVRSTGRIDAKKRFYRETGMAASFEHPNILRPVDVSFDDEALYCIYPYVNGTTLHELLSEKHRIGELDALAVAKQLLSALSYIHARGIIHADVNPFSVFISSDRGIRLLDFGSSLTDEEAECVEEGVTVGTFPYLSPEQMGCTRFKIDTRTDLYCVAVILYRCIAGALPFPMQQESIRELLDASIRREIPGIKHVPQFINEILLKGLRPSPIDRYQTAEGMLSDITVAAEKIKNSDNEGFPAGRKDAVLAVNRKRMFVVREKEIGTLCRGLKAFENGRIVSFLIYGKSGIGKTELIREFRQNIDIPDTLFLEAKCNRFSTSQPGSIYRQIVIEFLHRLSKVETEERRRLRERINSELREYSGFIARIIPEMARWFDKLTDVQTVEREKEKDRLVHVLTRVLSTICSLGRCVIHIDDMQWIDKITAEVVFRLLEQKFPCFFICSFRTTDDGDHLYCHGSDLTAAGFGRILRLREFDREETAEFIDRKFKHIDNPGLLVEALHERTDGVPYLLTEALRYLVNNDLVTLKDNVWNFAIEDINNLPLKFDAVSLVLQKVRDLAENERKILQTASLIEGRFDCTTLECLMEGKYRCSHRVIASFETDGFILSHLTGGYGFVHDRIQESIANDIPPEERFSVYEKLGRLYAEKAEDDREKLFSAAEYYLKTKNAVEALSVCYRAAVYAMEKNAYDIAIKYFRNITLLAGADLAAREAAGIDCTRVNILLGDVLMLTGANEQALEIFARVITDKQLQKMDKLEIEYKIGSIYHHTGEFELSSKYFMQSLATVGIRIPRNRLLLGIAILGEMTLQCISRLGVFRMIPLRSDSTSRIIVKIMNKLAYSLYFNDMVKGYYVHFRVLNLADLLADCAEKAESYSLHQIHVYQMMFRRRAGRYLKKSAKIAAAINRRDVLAFAESFGGLTLYYSTRWSESEQLLQSSLAAFRSIGDLNNQILSSEHLWKIALLRKPLKATVDQMDHTIELCKNLKEKYFSLITQSARNLCTYLLAGKLDEEVYEDIQSRLRKVHSLLFHVEAGGYLLQTEVEHQDYQRAYNRAVQLLPMIIRNCINSEYQVRGFSLFCNLICRELRGRRHGEERIAVGGKRLHTQFLFNSAIHFLSCFSYPAYWGVFFRNVAWYTALKGMNGTARLFFRKAIRAHHRLGMRYEEACSIRDHGEFLDEFCHLPGEAHDQYQKAFELFKWCGARLQFERLEGKIEITAQKQAPEGTAVTGFHDPKADNDSSAEGINHLRFETLVDVSRTITETDDPSILLQQILSAMITVTGAQYGCLFINKQTYGDLEPIAMSFEGKEVPVSEVPVFTDLIQKVNEIHTLQCSGEPLLDENLETDGICIRSDLCVPLNWREKYLGYVYLVNDRVLGLFGEGAQKAALVLAAHAGILLENAWLMSKQKEFNEELQQQVASQTENMVLKNQQLEEANLKLIESERMKGILSGTLVHDIKNYAAGITGNLVYLNRRIENDPKAQRVIDVVCETCGDIASLASNLLDIAKMDDGKMVVREEPLDYCFFEEVAGKFSKSTLFEEKEIVPKIIPPADEFIIAADMYLMERLMQNLYSNAAKYAPRGSTVELRFHTVEEERIICFFNSGSPIPESEKEILFEKYARLKSRHSHFSKGLGLFFCRMVMNAHRGRIWLDTDQTGNYFKLAFPKKTVIMKLNMA